MDLLRENGFLSKFKLAIHKTAAALPQDVLQIIRHLREHLTLTLTNNNIDRGIINENYQIIRYHSKTT
jgi:hypothetical protein